MSASPDPSEVLADGRHLRDMFAVEALKGLIGSASQVEAAHDMSTTTPMTPTEILVGTMTAFETAGIGPEDVDVIQLQDTDAGAEVIHLAENGFCADGDQEALVADGELEIGGRLPVNTDGGLIANGEPIGASGLRQIHEVVLQLRGQAGDRQIPGDPKVGYTQLYGAPGVAGVSILSV